MEIEDVEDIISIHTPTQGVTMGHSDLKMIMEVFQSTPPRRE